MAFQSLTHLQDSRFKIQDFYWHNIQSSKFHQKNINIATTNTYTHKKGDKMRIIMHDITQNVEIYTR